MPIFFVGFLCGLQLPAVVAFGPKTHRISYFLYIFLLSSLFFTFLSFFILITHYFFFPRPLAQLARPTPRREEGACLLLVIAQGQAASLRVRRGRGRRRLEGPDR